MFKFSGCPYLRSARRERRFHFTEITELVNRLVIGISNRLRPARSHEVILQWNVDLSLRRHDPVRCVTSIIQP